MNDSVIARIITNLMRHAQISELESLDIRVLRQLENQASNDLDAANELLNWIEAVHHGRLRPEDIAGEMERQADIAVVNASNKLQWISNIIDRKLGLDDAATIPAEDDGQPSLLD